MGFSLQRNVIFIALYIPVGGILISCRYFEGDLLLSITNLKTFHHYLYKIILLCLAFVSFSIDVV